MGCTKETDLSDLNATNKSEPPSSQTNQDHSGDPVNIVTGAFTLDEHDLAFPTQRLVVNLTRHYDNQQHNQQMEPGPFGWGWTHSFNLYVEEGPGQGQWTYVDDRGSRITFEPGSVPGDLVPPPGALGLELSLTDDGNFRLRQVDGLIAEFNADGKIASMIRPGPQADSSLCIRYDELGRIRTVMGAGERGIRFHYQDGSKLIYAVTDHTGREWRYGYDQHQNLISVLDPAGRVRRYRYGFAKVDVTVVETDDDEKQEAKIITREVKGLQQVLQYQAEGNRTPPVAEVTNQYTSDYRVHQQTDTLGNITRFDYNRFTRMTYLTDPAGWTTVYCYDEAGNTTKIRTPEGGTTEYVYDERRNLLAEIDPLGHRIEYAELKDATLFDHELEFGRRALGNRSDYVTIPTDKIVVGYDEQGNRPMMRDALGNTYRYLDYTRFGKACRIILPTGEEIHFTYDEHSGLPLRMERMLTAGRSEPLRWIEEWVYDPWGNVIHRAEWTEGSQDDVGARRITDWTYDEHGHHPISKLSWICMGDGQDIFPSEEEFEWDTLGRLTIHRVLRREAMDMPPEILVTQYGYDILGRPIWEIAPDGIAQCQELDLEGRVIESFLVENATAEELEHLPENQRRMRHRWSYDLLGREVRHTDPTGATTLHEWDERGLCTRVLEPTGFATHYEYDRDGRETLRRTSTGYEVQTVPDPAGHVLAQEDSAGLEQKWEYDARGRAVRALQRIEDVVVETYYAYDEFGRLVETRYADGAYERLVYDEFDNTIRQERGPTQVSIEVYDYDGLGRLAKIKAGTKDELQTQFTFRYDDAQRAIETYDALGNMTCVLHDSEGNVIRKMDAEGRELRFRYDERGRLTHRWDAEGLVDAYLEYDEADRLLMAREGPILYRWDYDDAGRVLRHHQKLGEIARETKYQYDPAGRLVHKKANDLWWMSFCYASNSNFVSQINLPGRSISISTDALGRITEERWDDGGFTRYDYAPDGVLTTLQSVDRQGKLVFGQQFTRDMRRRPATEVRQQHSRSRQYSYQYDALDRLERVECATDSSCKEFRRYVLDALDNRLAEYRNELLYKTHRYDCANRLLETADSQGQIETYEYDRCGNLTGRGQRRFTYDAEQRLRAVYLRGAAEPLAQYQYSATDQRALIVRQDGTEHILYDSLQEVLWISPNQQRMMFWGLQLDTLLATVPAKASTPQRVLTDMHGSIINIDESQRFLDYDPFGELITDRDQPTSFGFGGKIYDEILGLYHFRARPYDSTLGRFTQPDPLQTIDGPNPYVYARANPLAYGDPWGLVSEKSSQGRICDARPAESPSYSVVFEARLERGIHYPGVSETAHYAEANQQLYQAMKGNPAFARALETTYPGITKGVAPGPRGAFPSRSPTSELTWHHHASRAGVMQLVPRAHHAAPGPVQSSLHPGGKGGMETWGGGRR